MAQWDYLFEDEAPKTDVGPEARRARAGMAPSPRTDDPNPSGAIGGVQNERQRAMGVRATRYEVDPESVTPTTEPGAASAVPPIEPRVRVAKDPNDPIANDPLAQSIVAAGMTAPLGVPAAVRAAAVPGAVAGTAARTAVGAATGAATSKMTGGSGMEGAAVGGLLALGPALANVGASMARKTRMLDVGITQDLAAHVAPGSDELNNLIRMGYAKTAETARKYGVVGAKDPIAAKKSIQAAREAVGEEIGDVYSTVGAEHARDLGNITSAAARRMQALRTTTAGRKVADAMEQEMELFFDVHGGSAQSKIPLGKLREELTKSQQIGYSGTRYGKLSEVGKKEVQREIADILKTEMNAGLEAAGADPRFASAVARIPELNSTFHAIAVLDDVTSRMAAKALQVQEATMFQRAKSHLPRGELPAAAQPVTPPTGKRLGTVDIPPIDFAAAQKAALAPEMTSALVNKDQKPEGVTGALRRIFFGGGGAQ